MALDYSKLDDDQRAIALKVGAAAEKYHLNPDFVLPMVMAESGFRHIKNPKSAAFGVMQLMPETAKGLGVNSEDVDENIDGGVRLLKELSDNPKIGNDPYKILAGYNAKPTTPFIASGDLKDLPSETVNHMARVSEFYGGDVLPHPMLASADAVEPEAAATPTPVKGAVVEEAAPGERTLSPAMLSVLGGGTGTAVGAGVQVAEKGANLAKYMYGRFFPGEQNIPRVSEPTFTPTGATATAEGLESAAAAGNASGHERWLAPRSATPIPKAFSNEMVTMTGGANVPGSGENVLARNAAAVQKLKELGYNPLTMPTTGDLLLPQTSQGRAPQPQVWKRPRAIGPVPWAAPAPAPVPAPTVTAPAVPIAPAATAADESIGALASRYLGKAMPVLAPIAKVGFSGLSGALGANQLYKAEMDRKKHGLTLRNSLDYLSGTGGLVGMIPTLPTQIAAAALQLPAGALAAYDSAVPYDPSYEDPYLH